MVFTHDLDFGTILALTRGNGPSVIQVRAHDVLPVHLEQVVVTAVRDHEMELEKGAIVTVVVGGEATDVRFPYILTTGLTMIAKKTSKNQLTLPKKVVEQFPDVDYFDVRFDESQITLVPVRPGQLRQVWSRLEELGISDKDLRDAVAFGRASRRRAKG